MVKPKSKPKTETNRKLKKDKAKPDRSELIKGYVNYPNTVMSRSLFLKEKIGYQYIIELNGKQYHQERLDKRLITELHSLGATIEKVPTPPGLKGRTRLGKIPIKVSKRPKTVTAPLKDGTQITLNEGDFMINVTGMVVSEVISKTKQVQEIVTKAAGITLTATYVCVVPNASPEDLALLEDSEIPAKYLKDLPAPTKSKPKRIPKEKDTLSEYKKAEIIEKAKKYDMIIENKLKITKEQLQKTRIKERKVESDVLR